MDNMFMNSENSETSDRHRLLFSLSDKKDLKRRNKYVTLSNLNIKWTRIKIKEIYENKNVQRAIKKFIYLINDILYPIWKIILIIS